MEPVTKLERLIAAITTRDLSLIQQVISDPEVNINSHDDSDWTPLHYACSQRSLEAVKLLLGTKGIDVNPVDVENWTPFMVACYFGFDELVAEFLKDPRIDVNLGDSESKSPLWYAMKYGYLSTVKLLLASPRLVVNPLEDYQLEDDSSSSLATSAENARTWVMQSVDQDRVENYQTATELFHSFQRNPQGVRRALRRQLELDEPRAGELFSLVVYLSDGYLDLAPIGTGKQRNKGERFFQMASSLPLDLQMVLCSRTFGLGDDVIKWKYSERGFQKFARD